MDSFPAAMPREEIERKMPGVFLSHTWSDKEFVRKLAGDLIRAGARVWIDEAEIKLGDSLLTKIQEGIDTMEYLAVVLSPDAVRSEWVKREVEVAMNHEIAGKAVKVLPLLYRECELPGFLIGKLYADFTEPARYEASLRLILDRLRIGGGQTAPASREGEGKHDSVRDSVLRYIEELQSQRDKDPSNPNIYYDLGILHLKIEEIDQAELYFQKAADLDPTHASALHEWGKISLDKSKNKVDADKACENLRRANCYDPEFELPWVEIGKKYLEIGEIREAIYLLEEGFKSSPDPHVSRLLGQAHQANQDPCEAQTYLSIAEVNLPPDDELEVLLGEVIGWCYRKTALREGTYDRDLARLYEEDAVRHFRNAIRINEKNAWAHCHLGNFYSGEDDQLALRHLRRAVEIAPSEAHFHYRLASTLRDVGSVEEARDSCREAIAIDSNSERSKLYVELLELLER